MFDLKYEDNSVGKPVDSRQPRGWKIWLVMNLHLNCFLAEVSDLKSK